MADGQSFTNNLTILIISNDPSKLTHLSDLLKGHFASVKVADDRKKALKIIQSNPSPNIILLETAMPKAEIHEICKQLKADPKTCEIPIIALIGNNEVENFGLDSDVGAVDYLAKPYHSEIVLARVKTQLELKRMQGLLGNHDGFIAGQVKKQTTELMVTQDVIIHAMAYLAETRENVTGNHIFRNQYYVKILADKLRPHPRYNNFLSDGGVIELLFTTAPLHDIGHVGIPDRILLKPGRLTSEEFDVMKSHTRLGLDVILKAERDLGIEVPVFKFAKEIINSHHEKWDGSGYPEGLAGDGIPISARIMAIADVYDALISRRIYKPPISHEQAVKIILESKGTQFDPDIVDAFHDVHVEFQRIAHTYSDNDLDFRKKIEYLEKAIAIDP